MLITRFNGSAGRSGLDLESIVVASNIIFHVFRHCIPLRWQYRLFYFGIWTS